MVVYISCPGKDPMAVGQDMMPKPMQHVKKIIKVPNVKEKAEDPVEHVKVPNKNIMKGVENVFVLMETFQILMDHAPKI